MQQVISECLPLFLSIGDESVCKELLAGFENFIPSTQHGAFHDAVRDYQNQQQQQQLKRRVSVGGRQSLKDVILERAAQKKVERIAESNRAVQEDPVVVASASPANSLSPPPPPVAPSSPSTPHHAQNAAGAGSLSPPSSSGASPQRLRCPICLGGPKNPFFAPCGHVACLLCWQSCLEQKIECPVCRAKCRFNKLRKIYF